MKRRLFSRRQGDPPPANGVVQEVVQSSVEVAQYEPHPDDPSALLKDCPVCPAKVGFWCGGMGDVHAERE